MLMAVGAAGCTKETIPSPDKAPSALFTFKETKKSGADGPKRQPKHAEFCSSAGALLEHGGDVAKDVPTRQQKYHQARLAYDQALFIDAKHRLALLGLARLQSKEGNHQRAIEGFKAALAFYPNDAELWHEMGMCWARQKQWKEALPALQKAASLDPRNAAYANNYGWSLARAGYFPESFEHFCRTVGEARAHYNLARMAQHMGYPDVCKQYLEAALKVDPQFPEAQQLLAQLSEAGDPNIRQTSAETPR
jgi:Tfp pilus assembly protein PilF